MKFLATLAFAVAVSMEATNKGAPTAAQAMAACDKNGDKTLEYPEVVACMTNVYHLNQRQQRWWGTKLLKQAYIPSSNWEKIADWIAENKNLPAAKVEAALKGCDTNGNGSLSYDETKACLEKYQKELGLNTRRDWFKAKWLLAKVAQINMAGLEKVL